MARIMRFGFVRYFRSEANSHVIRYRKGTVLRSGRGLSFWFRPDGAGIAEIPMGSREMRFLFKSRSKDGEQAKVQGEITWRVADPDRLSRRVDFSVDLKYGHYPGEPLDRTAELLTGLLQPLAAQQHLATHTMDQLITQAGRARLQGQIEDGLKATESLRGLGLEILAVRLTEFSPPRWPTPVLKPPPLNRPDGERR